MNPETPTAARPRADAVRRILQWPVEEWVALARAAVLVARIEVGLRTTSLAGLGQRLGVTFDEAAGASSTAPAVNQLDFTDEERRGLRAISRVLRCWPFGDTCLRQCLASGAVLRARGPRLVIGVSRDSSTLAAHSWLAVGGGALDPLSPSGHAPLARVAAQPIRRP